MIIETERLIIRPFERQDFAPCIAMNADAHIMRYFERPLTADETESAIARYSKTLNEHGFGFVAAELEATGDFVGIIGMAPVAEATRDLIPGRPAVEIGWRLRSEYWGQGLAPEGAEACLAYAWDKLELDEVMAMTFKGNQPSRRVMEKIGMSYDPDADFVHPAVTAGHDVAEHVVYRSFNPNRVQN